VGLFQQHGNSDNLQFDRYLSSKAKAPQNFYGTTGQVDSPPCTIPTPVVVFPVALSEDSAAEYNLISCPKLGGPIFTYDTGSYR